MVFNLTELVCCLALIQISLAVVEQQSDNQCCRAISNTYESYRQEL
jgi:hypothetical protein